MKKRPSITLLTVLLAMVFAAGIGVYSSYIGMKIYQESSDHLLESFSQISETFTLFVQRNWTVLSQWDGLLKNADIDHADSIGADMQANKESWHYSDFYLFNESTQYLTADGRRGSADSISGVIQEMYSEGGPIVSTYTASYGVPKIVFAMPLSRNMTLDGVTYTGLAVSYDTDVVDDLVDGLAADLAAAARAVRRSGARPQQAQVVVNFRHRAHGRAWVAGRRLLVDGNGGGQAFDHVHVGLVHLAQELPRIGRKRVDIAPPALGIDRVERKRRFAGAGKPREYAQRVARDLHIHIFQVVFARTAHEDGISHSCLLPMISLKSYYTTLSGSQQRKFINKCTISRRPHTPL